ncbi:GntR family transcriptional regulator [Rhizobium sp. LEGMi198b]|uniref:GntR family transcriptional regulator n=1 Tax=unclassified Rhizobium TaxID=2613769 RepID=UPI000CDF3DCF|nr:MULTISPECIES: GntR family transcriptional regulator [Rhizobium]AVA24607.1 GntR family transcriptional regulator protein [Rhizobium sp. NXC24]MDK4740467.1 GntR family transcriptional regulator [Rhizobium sp. CNPSo 3464]UWU24523.1 GntR family transcriptional regulator [Rhizobium tropici]WFU05498.1 GntR family transcriptional regulator [Rhizobium sp. CB3171]
MREQRTDQKAETPKETGSSRVYQKLRDDILRVHIAPGAPLDEISLSERFDLSRSPIREALVRLSGEGLVQILPNRSTIVTPMEFDKMPEFLDALDLLQRVVTRLAALHRTSADFTKIRAAQKNYEVEAQKALISGDCIGMIEKNFEFHMSIAYACRNSYFADSYRRLLQEGRRLLFFHFKYQSLDPNLSVEELAEGHTAMVAAIEEQNADAAEHQAHLHAVQFRGRFMEFLNQNLTAKLSLDYGK